MKNFKEKRVYIEDYGFRYDWQGRTFRCGTRPIRDYLRIPNRPTLNHSVVKLLWAIEFATAFLQDAPTRKQVVEICKMSESVFANSNLMSGLNGYIRPGKADIKHYWTDLYRLYFVKQYRRSYGRGSKKHFDIVYELTDSAKHYLSLARENTFVDRMNK